MPSAGARLIFGEIKNIGNLPDLCRRGLPMMRREAIITMMTEDGSNRMSQTYDHSFYEGQVDGSARSAGEVVPIVLRLMDVSSVCDVGCGLGTWLAAFRQHGVDDVCGIDGDYVPRELLHIPGDAFVAADLSRPLQIGRTFDLAMSLEVAEHITSTSAQTFVASLTRLAPVVLFSAAVPHQGGRDHINEQWPDYWANLFSVHGFVSIDALRWRIWDHREIEFWYRQNIFFYVRESAIDSYPQLLAPIPVLDLPRNVVHPDMFDHKLPTPEYLTGTLKKLPRLFAQAIARRLATRSVR